jgi:hypothetical protein
LVFGLRLRFSCGECRVEIDVGNLG